MARTTVAPREAVLSKLAELADASGSPVVGITSANLADLAGIGRSTAGKVLVVLESEGKVNRIAGARVDGRKQADSWSLARQPEPVAAEASTSKTQLHKGELRAMVLEHLRAHPGEHLSPSTVAKALGHSAGAITNALVRLAAAGSVEQVSDKPRRFAVAASSHAEAGTGSQHVTRTGREALERMLGPERATEAEASLTGQPVARHSVSLDLSDEGPADGGAVIYPFFRS